MANVEISVEKVDPCVLTSSNNICKWILYVKFQYSDSARIACDVQDRSLRTIRCSAASCLKISGLFKKFGK